MIAMFPMKNLVLIGGGHSHAIALRLWGRSPLPGVRLTLITNSAYTPYSGMLPGHLGGIYTFEECHINLEVLAQFAQAHLVLDSAMGLDLEQNRVLCHQHPPIPFDWLSIDIGSTPAISGISGVTEYAMAAKPVPQFLADWDEFLQKLRQELSLCRSRPLSLGIVGGGAGGVELALTLQSRLKTFLQLAAPWPLGVNVHLFHRRANLMTGYAATVGKRFRKVLGDRRIDLHLNESVVAIEPVSQAGHPLADLKRVQCASGLSVACDRIIWVTHAASPQWIQGSGLATDAQGFILIDQTLQSLSHPNIFATGDIAAMVNYPRPKAGVFAVRQGKPLFENLHRIASGQTLQPFQPQKHHLALIGLGDRQAIAAWGSLCIGPSSLLWFWKDWIDRRFMAQFKTLPGAILPNPPQHPQNSVDPRKAPAVIADQVPPPQMTHPKRIMQWLLIGSILIISPAITLSGVRYLATVQAAVERNPNNFRPQSAYTLIQQHRTAQNLVVLDVRTPQEYAEGHLDNAINLDFYRRDFQQALNRLDRQKTYLIYCHTGVRSSRSFQMMQKMGFRRFYNLGGGFNRWKQDGLPTTLN